MSYQALARKYRPQTFEELVGQEHVTRTLVNAIKSEKVSHAYLFSGPRGVGKTTTARILAKTLNCQAGPVVTPCNKCNNCREITDGYSLDVQEIDGASNRGIDDIRTLRENVKFVPSSGKYKVYIIDEVHQITKEGFNALLKTLEEPPAHVIFMMATTEPEKIPQTILSRCQKFAFKLITQPMISRHLKNLAGREKIEINDDALNLIAACGQGSVRDSISILDQIISYCAEKTVKKEDVIYILGLIPEEILNRFADNISSNDVKSALGMINEVVENGYDIHQLISDLRTYFRNMLMVKAVGKDQGLVGVSGESLDVLLEKSGSFTEDSIIKIIDELSFVHEKMKWSEHPRTVLEIGIYKLCQPYVSIESILEKLSKLEGNMPGMSETPASTAIKRPEPAMGAGNTNIIKPAGETEPQTAPKTENAAPVKKQETKPETGKAEVNADDGQKWHRLLEAINEESPMLYENLSKGVLEKIADNVVFIGFHRSNHFRKSAVERKIEIIKEKVSQIYGSGYSVKFTFSDSAPEMGYKDIPDPADENVETEEPVAEDFYQELKKTDPVVSKVIDMFKVKIVKKRKKPGEGE